MYLLKDFKNGLIHQRINLVNFIYIPYQGFGITILMAQVKGYLFWLK